MNAAVLKKTAMEISLYSDFEKFINEQTASGIYKSVNDAIAETMTLLIYRKSISKSRIDMLNQNIDTVLKFMH